MCYYGKYLGKKSYWTLSRSIVNTSAYQLWDSKSATAPKSLFSLTSPALMRSPAGATSFFLSWILWLNLPLELVPKPKEWSEGGRPSQGAEWSRSTVAEGQERTVRKEGMQIPLRPRVSEVPRWVEWDHYPEVEACVVSACQGETARQKQLSY